VDISGSRVVADTYNGSFSAPTLEVHQGDRIAVTLVNRLDAPTNFHFHGFHVSPAGHGDNVLAHIEPGASRLYSVRVGPGNQPGTYWYHSHSHGLSEGQVMNGLAGLIVVDGVRARLGPGFRHITERPIGLQAIQTKDGGIPTDFEDISFARADRPGGPPNTRLVEGRLEPRMRIAPGETQLWRLANISADVFYRLSLDGTRFTVVAEDANLLDRPHRAKTLLLPPGTHPHRRASCAASTASTTRGSSTTGGSPSTRAARETTSTSASTARSSTRTASTSAPSSARSRSGRSSTRRSRTIRSTSTSTTSR
jgi:suppressor of ftsI